MTSPRLARTLLRLAAKRGEADNLIGDLEEAHRARLARRGILVAGILTHIEALDIALAVWRGRLLASRSSKPGVHIIQWLDVKLGVRLLARNPGLSITAVTSLAAAIAIGVGAFSVIASLTSPTLPLPDGDRIVALRNEVITEAGLVRASLRDFEIWRADLESVRDITAFLTVRRNLVVKGRGVVDLVPVVRMTASGFVLARISPFLGRTLVEEDQRTNARVLVLGFDEWQHRFGGDPSIVGRSVGLGTEIYTIVGVMPRGFHFPFNDGYWIPLVISAAAGESAEQMAVTIAGRLSDGASLERAEAELAVIGARVAAASPGTHGALRPRVMSYPRAFFDVDSAELLWTLQLFQFVLSLLVVLVAVNVAVLVYARTATRVGEIAVRTALGATRLRIVRQLLVEALVISLTAAVIGLMLAGVALSKLELFARAELVQRRLGRLPFWIDLGMTPALVAYALGLAVIGALIVGVVPALKATGSRMQLTLQRFNGRSAQLQLGRVWTSLIVTQVAIAVAVLPFALHFTQDLMLSVAPAPMAAHELLESTISARVTPEASEQRFRSSARALISSLESESAVANVKGSSRTKFSHIEIAQAIGRDAEPTRQISVRADLIEPGFFELYGMPILAGRTFVDADTTAGAVMIVNQVFVERSLGEAPAIGRRVRLIDDMSNVTPLQTSPWLQIIGVVKDLADHESKRVYLPADIARLGPDLSLAIRTRLSPATRFVPRLREIAAATDPALEIENVASAADLHTQAKGFTQAVSLAVAALTGSVLLLSAAGVYALVSFTVARRRREIGIRAALGADARKLLQAIFARIGAQLGAGVVCGVIGAFMLDAVTGKGPVQDGNTAALFVVAMLLLTIGFLAAIGPARRGLRIQPTEALRQD